MMGTFLSQSRGWEFEHFMFVGVYLYPFFRSRFLGQSLPLIDWDKSWWVLIKLGFQFWLRARLLVAIELALVYLSIKLYYAKQCNIWKKEDVKYLLNVRTWQEYLIKIKVFTCLTVSMIGFYNDYLNKDF